jgi:tRNA 2-thiouridine synthesizing protein A
MTDNPTVTLDTSGLPCPAPLLGAKKLVDDLQPGQTLKLISDCQGTADDLFAWARYTGNQVLETRKLADGKTAYVIQRAGSAAATPIPHVTLDMRGVSCPGPHRPGEETAGRHEGRRGAATGQRLPGIGRRHRLLGQGRRGGTAVQP